MRQSSFSEHPGHFKSVVDAVLAAADPGEALVRHWPTEEREAAALRGGVLVAAGKASVGMARAAVERLGVKPSVGVVLVPAGSRPPQTFHAAGLRVFEVDHPLPTQRNLIAARAVGDAARLASSRKVPLVVLLSGGASAHLTVPDRGLTLSDVRTITDVLLKSGATIAEINVVRSCCETLKAGGLARLAAPSSVHAFILSDVLGDPAPVGVIASGPTADVKVSAAEAMRVLESRSLTAAVPTITAHIAEQVKKPPVRAAVTNATNIVIGSNNAAVVAARAALEGLGFAVVEARTSVEGDAATRGRELAAMLLARQTSAAGGGDGRGGGAIAVVWGGETTVEAHKGGSGAGGRNQEAALAAAIALEGRPNVALMCFATDGVDGFTPAAQPPHAGAIITGNSVAAARGAVPAVDPAAALAGHDSYGFTKAAGAAIKTGQTGTNVNDIWVGLAYANAT